MVLSGDGLEQDWTPDYGCPACRSMDIATVSYRPNFPGADIPRDQLSSLDIQPYTVLAPAQEPSLALTSAIPEFD